MSVAPVVVCLVGGKRYLYVESVVFADERHLGTGSAREGWSGVEPWGLFAALRLDRDCLHWVAVGVGSVNNRIRFGGENNG